MYYKVQFWSKTGNKQNTEALIWNEILFYTVTLIRDDFYLRKIGQRQLIFTVKPYLSFLYLYDKKKIAGRMFAARLLWTWRKFISRK